MPAVDAGARLERLVRGYQFTQALRVAVELAIPEALADGPQHVHDLAARCGADRDSLARLLRALTSVGVLDEPTADIFAATDLCHLLRPGVEGNRRDWLLMSAIDLYQTWAHLGHSVRTGETATSLLYGTDSWTYRAQHPEQAARFDAGMSENARRRVAAFVATYPLAGRRTVVDVGGGRGALLAGITRANPSVDGVLFDLPHVVAGTPNVLAAAGVADRIEIVAGNFFVDELPAGADVYVLCMVLHDWGDADAIAIVERCRAAMAADGVVLLYERVLGDGATRDWEPYFSDLNMLQGPGGRERSESEWRDVLAAGGLTLRQVVPTEVGLSILEAAPRQA